MVASHHRRLLRVLLHSTDKRRLMPLDLEDLLTAELSGADMAARAHWLLNDTMESVRGIYTAMRAGCLVSLAAHLGWLTGRDVLRFNLNTIQLVLTSF